MTRGFSFSSRLNLFLICLRVRLGKSAATIEKSVPYLVLWERGGDETRGGRWWWRWWCAAVGGRRASGGAPLECEVEAVGVGGAPRLRGRAVEVRARRDRHRIALLDPAAAAREVGRAARRRDVERVLIEHDLAVDDPQLRRERRRRRRRRLDLGRLRRHRRRRRRPRGVVARRARRLRHALVVAAVGRELHRRARGDRGGVVGGEGAAGDRVGVGGVVGGGAHLHRQPVRRHVLVLERLALGVVHPRAEGRHRRRPARRRRLPPPLRAQRRRLHRHADRALHHDLAHRHVLDRHPPLLGARHRASAAFRDVARAPSGPCHTEYARPLAGVRRSMRHPGNSGPASS